MNFNKHLELEGKHALLSPSGYNWINYDIVNLDSFFSKYKSQYAQEMGTVLHEYAEKRIRYRLKLQKNDKNDILFYLLDHGIPRNIIDFDIIYDNMVRYINDAIGFKMQPEVVLYYSKNCFGTADTIDFKNKLLKIFDLKTGVTPVHIEQLKIYAALFCLEYDVKPAEIEYDLRIYQSQKDILYCSPEGDEIAHLMDKIVHADKIINDFKEEA